MLSNLADQFSELFETTCSPLSMKAGLGLHQISLHTNQRDFLFGKCELSRKSLLTLKYLTQHLSSDRLDVDVLVHVIDENGNFNVCAVVVNDPSEVSFLTASSYTLVETKAAEQELSVPQNITIANFDGKVPVYVYEDQAALVLPLFPVVASVLWFVTQQLIYEGMGNTGVVHSASPILSAVHLAVKQKLFEGGIMRYWYYVRCLFKLLAFLEARVFRNTEQVAALEALCSSLDLDNPLSTVMKLYANPLFAEFDFVDTIDVQEEEEEEPVMELEAGESLVQQWTYSYEHNGTAKEWELEVSPCAEEGCGNQVVFGGPFCRIHTRRNLNLNILLDQPESEGVYVDGVYTANAALKAGQTLLTLTKDFVVPVSTPVFRKNYYSDISTYLPYSIQLPNKKWMDGSSKRYLPYMIQHSEEPNVVVDTDAEGNVVLRAVKDIAVGEELLRRHAHWDKHDDVDYSTFLQLELRENKDDDGFVDFSVDTEYTNDEVLNAVQLLTAGAEENLRLRLQRFASEKGRPLEPGQLEDMELTREVLQSPEVQSLKEKLGLL